MWSVVVFSILINAGTYKSYDALNQKNVRFVFNNFRNHIKIIFKGKFLVTLVP